MLSWFVRGLLIVAGLVTSWFVAADEPKFSVVQMTIAVLLCVLVVFVLAFWPQHWTERFNRLLKGPPPA